jgi:hypothetical protein
MLICYMFEVTVILIDMSLVANQAELAYEPITISDIRNVTTLAPSHKSDQWVWCTSVNKRSAAACT